MTREEAILILKEEAEFLYGGDAPYNKTAFDMAIEALSQVWCNDCKWNDDVIEVVRCKDCRWFKQDSSPVGYGYCDGRMVGREVDYNDYCSHGERQCNYFGERREP